MSRGAGVITIISQGRSMNSAGVAQLVEHHVANVDVAGSSPVSRSTGKLAKWLRQRTLNPSILGSNPRFPTIYMGDVPGGGLISLWQN